MPSDNIDPMEIGDRIRKERLARGMTVRQLGTKIGTSGSAVSQWESGGGIDVKNRVLLSSVLDIPITDLMPKPDASGQVPPLTEQELLLIDKFRSLDPNLREAFLRMLIHNQQPPD